MSEYYNFNLLVPLFAPRVEFLHHSENTWFVECHCQQQQAVRKKQILLYYTIIKTC